MSTWDSYGACDVFSSSTRFLVVLVVRMTAASGYQETEVFIKPHVVSDSPAGYVEVLQFVTHW